MSSPDTSELQADAPSSRIDVDELVNYLETAPIRLAVFGEFSAGKTTVLNALIGEEILSVAVEPTTAVPTRVRYGREFNIFVHRTDGVSLPLFEDDPPFWTRFVGRRDMLSTLRRERASLQDFLRTWTKEGEQADQVERVEIQLPLDWLKDGLELVDTPGANNEFTRHHSFTEQEARTADIALLLMDARQGGGKRTEFEFMNNVQRQVPRCIVAPNKMDLVDAGEREEFIEYIREEALPQHWDGAVTPPVAGISALAALHPDQHDEPDLVAAFDDLKAQLETIATEQRGQLLLARRDNPVKQLFAEAKALEGEEKYDRAHRIYFDVLDILDAAGMDPAPAHEGIQRCETHLSTQVETLDRLNERYNEVVEEYENDPDGRLEALQELKADKTKLAIDDEKLNAEIQTLQNRIEKRDEARSRVEAIVDEVEQLRQDGKLIEATERAQDIRQHLDDTEWPEDDQDDLRMFIKEQARDRDRWAQKKWTTAYDTIQEHLAQTNYGQAEEQLDMLETVAPYITSDNHLTGRLVETVQRKAKKEKNYVSLIADIVEEVLEQNPPLNAARVPRDSGERTKQLIKEAAGVHKNLYGDAGLANMPDLSEPDLVADMRLDHLLIEEKVELANAAEKVADRAPKQLRKQLSRLTWRVKERYERLSRIRPQGLNEVLDVLDDYPDHSRALRQIMKQREELLSAELTCWSSPKEVNTTFKALCRLNRESQFTDEKVKRKIKDIHTKSRNSFFLKKMNLFDKVAVFIASLVIILVLTSISSLIITYIIFGSAMSSGIFLISFMLLLPLWGYWAVKLFLPTVAKFGI